MPIYAYKCESCGHSKDALQKISDAPLTVCPHCGAPTFKKQLTAAGFRLKGSGWYATDFRGGAGDAAAKPATATDDHKTEAKTDSKPSEGATTAKSDAAPARSEAAPAKPDATPAAATPSGH
ncbi:FmdB family zinc ribbon protein [Polaromonas sp. C04]|uniref:FmdB family zinc ribbon protein n=1 Tax=Polaromonas sp. C04 TaxID=1945857 RepID=UPI0009866583|nr:FmdB family zinc ribbon protein [Polaromonas sp. C04]OOG58598.1 FmdB family transcriptional regulator [Polaromonas sp. C04]